MIGCQLSCGILFPEIRKCHSGHVETSHFGDCLSAGLIVYSLVLVHSPFINLILVDVITLQIMTSPPEGHLGIKTLLLLMFLTTIAVSMMWIQQRHFRC